MLERTDKPETTDVSLSTDMLCGDLPSTPTPEIGTILVTGASGYIGGRLVPELQARGYCVRAMVRGESPAFRDNRRGVKQVVADALIPHEIEKALKGIHTAYYLIHSLSLGPGQFEATELEAARNFRLAAEKCGVKRVIYLGGLGDARAPVLSSHLRSRIEVAEELQKGAIPVTILRAAVIIGSGSASWEIIHHLVKRLRVILVPHWAKNSCQPVGIRDVMKYLVGVLEVPETAGMSFDIGGSDVLTYERMLGIVAKVLKRRVFIIPCPFSAIRSYSYLVSLFTPVPGTICRCLLEGLKDDVVCQDSSIRRYLPFEPLTYREAVIRALTREDQDRVYTRWSDAYPPAHELALKLRELGSPTRYHTRYAIVTEKSASSLFRSICRIGGREGWFHSNWIWKLRGILDRLLMGVGTLRGRRSYSSLDINDVIDFWRVEDMKVDQRLLLRAEMKIPGRAWLEFNIEPGGTQRCLSVNAHYDTDAILGKTYWYACLPLHHFIFKRLIVAIEKRS